MPDQVRHDVIGLYMFLLTTILVNALLLDALEANSTDAQTIVYVLADHGFGCPKPTQHGCSPHTFIASTDANLTGDLFMKDVAGYFLSHFGLTPVCP